ncbi:MAG: hypothetical protein WAM05_12925 [Candidatus Binataceae bacterium]
MVCGLIVAAAILAGPAIPVFAQNLLPNSAQNSQQGAGSELEIPIPQAQTPPPSRNNAQTETIPSMQPQSPPAGPQIEIPARQGPGASTLEIPLPKQFRGCWSGVVPRLDSIRMLGGPGVSKWIPKTYRICYEQTAGGPFRLTLSEAGLAGRNRDLTNVKAIMKVISTDGRTTAQMRALLHFDEPAGSMFGMFPGRGSVDELTNMTCRIDGGVMHVAASVYAQWNDRPWSTMTWHADFTNVPQ